MTAINEWAVFMHGLALDPIKTSKPNTKTFNGLCIPFTNLDNSYDLTSFGYKPESPKKMSQMMMHYFNTESVELAKKEYKKIVNKDGTGSVGVSCRGYRTGDKRQDFCIQGLTISKLYTGKTRIDIFHRNTELIKKFGADLVFFREKLMPHFDQLPIDSVNFYCANAQLNAMFYPLIIPYLQNWKLSINSIKLSDNKFYRQILRWSLRYVNNECQNYRFIKRVQDSLPRVMNKQLYKDFCQHIKELSNEAI